MRRRCSSPRCSGAPAHEPHGFASLLPWWHSVPLPLWHSVWSLSTSSRPGRRSEYKPHALRWRDVEGEGMSGKQFILPASDVRGHPVLVLRPRCALASGH